MRAKIFSAGSYWACSGCRESSEVFEFADTARQDAKKHDRECFSND